MPDVAYSLGGVRNETQNEADRTRARMVQMMFEREMRDRAEAVSRQNAQLGADLTREGWDRQAAATQQGLTAQERIAAMQTGTQERLAQMGLTAEEKRWQSEQGWRTAEQGRLSVKDAAEAERQKRLDALTEKEHNMRLQQMDPAYRDAEFQRQIAQTIALQKAQAGGEFGGFDPKTKMPVFTPQPGERVKKTAAATQEVAPLILPKYSARIQRLRDSGDSEGFLSAVNELAAELRAAGADERAVIAPLMERMRYSMAERITSPIDAPRINPTIEALGY